MEDAGDGCLPLPTLRLRSSLPTAPSASELKASPQPPLIRLLYNQQQAAGASAAASRKRKAEWVPKLACDCVDEHAHRSHVARCRVWPCSCKLASGSQGGGDNKHHADCMRGRLQRHEEPFCTPQEGDKVQMVGSARAAGMRDLICMGRSWAADPQGRPAATTPWVQSALLL